MRSCCLGKQVSAEHGLLAGERQHGRGPAERVLTGVPVLVSFFHGGFQKLNLVEEVGKGCVKIFALFHLKKGFFTFKFLPTSEEFLHVEIWCRCEEIV